MSLYPLSRISRLSTLLNPAVALFVIASTAIAADKSALPAFSKCNAVVSRHFEELPGHQAGDLISRSQVEPVFEELEKLGWKVAEKSAILGDVLDDGNYVVEKFRTDEGRKFMRKISRQPLAFDQIDRLARLPGGKLMVDDFLRFPHSDRSFDPRGEATLARTTRLVPQRGASSNPKEFDKPTGRIYTVELLLQRLEESYRRQK